MPPPSRTQYDAVVVGGGHNGLVAATLLARAGRSVSVLEQNATLGGAAISARVFRGRDARLSRYSYLVSLLPRQLVAELGLRFLTRPRRIASYTPYGDTGLLVDAAAPARTRAALRSLTGSDAEADAWDHLGAQTRALAAAIAPTLLQPLAERAAIERVAGDAWELVERPLGAVLEERFADDLVRGVVLTDGLIGTFADAHDEAASRCFLYHVIGNGTGDWDVPIGGMGALSDELARVARDAGAELVTGARVTAIAADGAQAEVSVGELTVGAKDVLAGVAPSVLAGLLGDPRPTAPEGAQLKVNMLLDRLPRLKDAAVAPVDAFAGTFHVAEGYAALQRAFAQARDGAIPDAPPSEIYCHSLTDPSILGPAERAAGRHTLTLFGLHMPARLFREDPEGAKQAALERTLQTLDAHLGEPIADCLAHDADGAPCLEASTPLDLETSLGLPAGHIFHGDLQWPWADDEHPAGSWGVETTRANVWLCGAGARRGGGVSGIPGHNAARAILGRD